MLAAEQNEQNDVVKSTPEIDNRTLRTIITFKIGEMMNSHQIDLELTKETSLNNFIDILCKKLDVESEKYLIDIQYDNKVSIINVCEDPDIFEQIMKNIFTIDKISDACLRITMNQKFVNVFNFNSPDNSPKQKNHSFSPSKDSPPSKDSFSPKKDLPSSLKRDSFALARPLGRCYSVVVISRKESPRKESRKDSKATEASSLRNSPRKTSLQGMRKESPRKESRKDSMKKSSDGTNTPQKDMSFGFDYLNSERESVFDETNVKPEFLDYIRKNDFDFTCLICRGLLFGPKACTGCDKLYCTDCIKKVDSICPDEECGSKIFDNIKKKNLIKKFEKVLIECENNCKTENLNFLNYYNHFQGCTVEQESAFDEIPEIQDTDELKSKVDSFAKALETDPNILETIEENPLENNITDRNKSQPVSNKSSSNKVVIKDSTYYSNLGKSLKAQGKLPEAEEAYRKALEINPKNTRVFNNLGNLLRDQGKIEEAEVCYKNALVLDPKGIAHTNLGNLYKEQGKLDLTEDYYLKAISISPKCIDAYYNLAKLYKVQKKFQEAGFYFAKTIELNKTDYNAHNGFGLLLREQGKFKEAEEYFRKSININPKNNKAYLNLGNLMCDLGKFSDAEMFFRKTIELDPKSVAHNNLGKLLFDQKRYTEAEKFYRMGIELDPQNSVLYNNLGTLLCTQRRLKEAKTYFSTAIYIDPKNRMAHNNLENLMREHKDNKGKTEKCLIF